MQWFRKIRIYPILFVCLCGVVALGFASLNPMVQTISSDEPGGANSMIVYRKASFAGSTGCIDEEDYDEVIFAGGRAKVPNSARNCTVRLRYNIEAFNNDGNDHPIDAVWIGIRYRDNGNHAQVIAKLKEYDFNTGAITTRLVFDSNDFSQNPDFQSQWVNEVDGGMPMIQNDAAYYLEVTIKKIGRQGKPELALIHTWVREA